MAFTEQTLTEIRTLKSALEQAENIVVGAGAGLSAAAGFTYSGDRFLKYFADFAKEFGIKDMYSGGFYPFDEEELFWGWWSRQIWLNRYECPVGQPYADLKKILTGKNYFVLTTNVDHQFQKAGFLKERLFYTQGDYGLWQCSKPCHDKTYDNYEVIKQMVETQQNMRVPTKLLPRCPKCGRPMVNNLRSDNTFVQDSGWYAAAKRYSAFIKSVEKKPVLYLELGVGGNTPGIIKYPFWRYTYQNPKATYVCINMGEAFAPKEILSRSICVDGDLAEVLAALLK